VRDRWARRDVLLHAEWAALCQLATAAARGSPAGASSVAASGAAGANGGGEGVNASGIGGGMVRALSRRLSWLSPSPPPPPPRSLPLRLPPEPFVGVIPGTVVLPAAASAAGALLGAVTATFPPSGAGARGAPASPAASKAGSGAAADATSVGLSLVTYAPALPALCLAHHLCSERGAPPLSALAQAAVALLANDRLHCLSLFFGVSPSPFFQTPLTRTPITISPTSKTVNVHLSLCTEEEPEYRTLNPAPGKYRTPSLTPSSSKPRRTSKPELNRRFRCSTARTLCTAASAPRP
jgi:hypothetical protein